ncbi:MAG: PAS domain-containing protein [Gammaproteobacteria bacterium]|jgi:PAS domain S-box-containing protein|nr:PAS domain-containing protein [Gammaproteobacteria bacterium]
MEEDQSYIQIFLGKLGIKNNQFFDVDKVQHAKSIVEPHYSKELFSLAMQATNDGMWAWNLETNEVYYSPRWKSMLGYEKHELAPNIDTWIALVDPEDKDWVLEKVQNYLEKRVDSFEIEMRMRHKGGHEIFVLSRCHRVKGSTDKKQV